MPDNRARDPKGMGKKYMRCIGSENLQGCRKAHSVAHCARNCGARAKRCTLGYPIAGPPETDGFELPVGRWAGMSVLVCARRGDGST